MTAKGPPIRSKEGLISFLCPGPSMTDVGAEKCGEITMIMKCGDPGRFNSASPLGFGP